MSYSILFVWWLLLLAVLSAAYERCASRARPHPAVFLLFVLLPAVGWLLGHLGLT